MKRISVFQIGARRSYATAEIFHRSNILDSLYTDLFFSSTQADILTRIAKRIGSHSVSRMAGRSSCTLPSDLVWQSRTRALPHLLRPRRQRSLSQELQSSCNYSDSIAEAVMKHIDCNTVLYTVNREAPKLGEFVRNNGGRVIVEQTITTLEHERKTLIEAEEKVRRILKNIPVLEETTQKKINWFYDRETTELDNADGIICVSNYVSESLRKIGLPDDKLKVVPSGLSLPNLRERKASRYRPLRVLFVGAVSLRKGAPVFLEMARRLASEMEFRMVGQQSLPSTYLASFQDAVEFVGPIPRAKVEDHWSWGDVLLFPSFNEGAAMVTYEALAHGLVVVCSRQSGSLVKEGINGFIVQPWDVDRIEECLLSINSDLELRDNLFEGAFSNRKDVSIERYGNDLVSAVSTMA